MLWEVHFGVAGRVECLEQTQTWRWGPGLVRNSQRRSDRDLEGSLGSDLRRPARSLHLGAHGPLTSLGGTNPLSPTPWWSVLCVNLARLQYQVV